MSLEKKPAFSLAIFLPFLLVIYFILHENNDNFALIPIAYSFKQTLYYLVAVIILSLVSWWLFKNASKVILFTTLIIAFLLFFGAFHDLLKESPLPHFFKKYKFILVFLFAVVVLTAVFLRRSGRNFRHAARYVQGVLVILCVWETASLVLNIVSGKEDSNILFHKADRSVTPGNAPGKYPNIYFIVFDSFTSSICLREEFGYDNSALDSFFRRNKFYTVPRSKSNYPLTVYSIASTMNYSYLLPEVNNQMLMAKDLVKGKVTVAHNRLIPFLESKGYTVYNYSGLDLPGHPAPGYYLLPDYEKKLLTQQTMAGRIKRDILWNLTAPDLDTTNITTRKAIEKARKDYYQHYVGEHLQGLQQSLESSKPSPKFVYCHVLTPHEPYLFNRDGSYIPVHTNKSLKQKYLDQLIYTNRLVQSVVNSILEKDRANKIIVVEGDHGFRDYGRPDKKDRFFDNLNAIYFYDQHYKALSDSITPVNTFRVVLNQYFGQHLSYLKDTSIYVHDIGFDTSGIKQSR